MVLVCISMSKSTTESVCFLSMMQRKREFEICLLCRIMSNSIRHKRIKGNPSGLPYDSMVYVWLKSFLMPNGSIVYAYSRKYVRSIQCLTSQARLPRLSCCVCDWHMFSFPLSSARHNLPARIGSRHFHWVWMQPISAFAIFHKTRQMPCSRSFPCSCLFLWRIPYEASGIL